MQTFSPISYRLVKAPVAIGLAPFDFRQFRLEKLVSLKFFMSCFFSFSILLGGLHLIPWLHFSLDNLDLGKTLVVVRFKQDLSIIFNDASQTIDCF